MAVDFDTRKTFLRRAVVAAISAGHIFPEYAACEAALESRWGTSRLAILGNNLFGQKAGRFTSMYPKIDLATQENVDLNHDGKVSSDEVVDVAHEWWQKFPDWKTCFVERMNLLKRSSLYAEAVAASNGSDFVRKVSAHWATDPERANKVISIYDQHALILSVAVACNGGTPS